MLNIPTKPTIFVQIASYRDRELVPTIRDILSKAANPERLTFGICWQHDNTEDLSEYLYDTRFHIMSVDWSASRGCCWARHQTQMMYAGEDFTLQIDSHMRFIQDWDKMLIELIAQCDYDKPIISYYPPPYEIKDGNIELCSYTIPQAITATHFESGFIPYFGSLFITGNPTKPTLGRFLAAGMLFTIGKWCEEVPYNPEIYFLGEEIDLALRSYTKGYNIYHPHKSVCYHYFIRKGEPRHWDDHTSENVDKGVVKETYVSITSNGFNKLQQLLWEDAADLGVYGLGTTRTKRDFEMFAGLNFSRRLIHPDANKNILPVTTDIKWEENVIPKYSFNHTIVLDLTEVPVLDDYEFWYFGLHSSQNVELWRQDFRQPEYLKGRRRDITINAVLDAKPATWILWPVSKSKGWLTKITHNIE